MENPEEVLQSLDEFSKLKPKDIPRELEEYLQYVAKTGDPVYQWSLVKCLFREKMLSVITDFYESCPSIDLPPCPNVDPFNYETMKATLLERLDSFASAPFTVQRLCELLTTPRKEYTRVDKFMRAIEKNILVVSTKEPGGPRGQRGNDPTQAEVLMNGAIDERALDIGDAIETVSSDGVSLMHGATVSVAAVAAGGDAEVTLGDRVERGVEDMELEEASDVAPWASVTATKVPECRIKPEAPVVTEVKSMAGEPEEEVVEAPASPDFTPEVFGSGVELGAVEAGPLGLTAAAAAEPPPPPPQPPSQQQEEQQQQPSSSRPAEPQRATRVAEEEPPLAPVVMDVRSLSTATTTTSTATESLGQQPELPQTETEKEPPKQATASVPAPSTPPEREPSPPHCPIALPSCSDAPEEVSTNLEANIADETNVEIPIPTGMLKSESLLKSLEEFADNLTGLEGASTPPFSELNTDEDTQDAVRGSDQLDDEDEEEATEVKEEVKTMTVNETPVQPPEPSPESSMEVDPPTEPAAPVVEQPPPVVAEEKEAEAVPAEVVTKTEEKPLEGDAKATPAAEEKEPDAVATPPDTVEPAPTEEPSTSESKDKSDAS